MRQNRENQHDHFSTNCNNAMCKDCMKLSRDNVIALQECLDARIIKDEMRYFCAVQQRYISLSAPCCNDFERR